MASPLIQSFKKQKNYYASNIKLLSPAKINLYLNIVGKYPSGFHCIESIVERVSLFDYVTIEITKEPLIRITSNWKELEGEHNLCFKAAKILKDKYSLPFGFHIFLDKKIPMGAGLGGGSSNAAIVLLGINKILDLHLSQEELYTLGSKIGSDVNFFLSRSQYAFMYGKGEKIIPFHGKILKHLIVCPPSRISTKKVYENTSVKLTKFFSNVRIIKYAIQKGDIFLLKKNVFNVLERSVFPFYLGRCPKGSRPKELEIIKFFLKDRKRCFQMTGSGSAFFSFFENSVLREEEINFPSDWSVFKVQTF